MSYLYYVKVYSFILQNDNWEYATHPMANLFTNDHPLHKKKLALTYLYRKIPTFCIDYECFPNFKFFMKHTQCDNPIPPT